MVIWHFLRQGFDSLPFPPNKGHINERSIGEWNVLNIGDDVVVAPKNYRGLVKATVKKFTKVKVYVEYVNKWNYGSPGNLETYLVNSTDVAKINS